jgi:hypothetical protein
MSSKDIAVNTAQYLADHPVTGAACTSIVSCTIAWLPIVTGWLQLVATLVAIASGVMAFVWHKGNVDERNRGRRHDDTESDTNEKH